MDTTELTNMRKTGFRKFNQYVTTWCMLSIASSHCILIINCDFHPKIRRRFEWKILAATWKWNDLTWLGAAKSTQVDLTAATLRSIIVCAISFQDFQPMWSQSTNATDRQTDRQTDGRSTCDCTKVHCAVKIGQMLTIELSYDFIWAWEQFFSVAIRRFI